MAEAKVRSHLDKPVVAAHVRELHTYLINDSGVQVQRNLDKELLDFYFDEHKIDIPNTASSKRKRKIKPERLSTGEPARVVDLATSFYSSPPIMDVDDIGAESKRSPKAKENAALALNEAIDQENRHVDSPWFIGAWSQVLLGRSAEIVAPGHAYWSDFPQANMDLPAGEREEEWESRDALWRRRAPLPITWQVLDAENTFPSSLASVNDEVLSWKEVGWTEIQQMFDLDELRKSKVEMPEIGSAKWFAPVTLGIYSNRQELAYMIFASEKEGGLRWHGVGIGGGFKDTIIRRVEHGQGRSAIRILPGFVGGRKEYGKYWRSILFPVLSLLKQADRYASRVSTASQFNTFPMLKEWINQTTISASGQGAGARAKNEEFIEGDVWSLDAGDPASGRAREDIEPVFQAQFGQETRELLIWTLERIGRITGASESLEGQVTSNTAAWTHGWSAEQARRKMEPLTKGVIARAIDISEGIMKSTIAFGEVIHMTRQETGRQMELDPADLEAFSPAISGEYQPKLPQNWLAQLSVFMEVMDKRKANGGFPSPIWAAKKLANIDNFWEQVREGMEVDILNDPDMRQALIKRAREQFDADMSEEDGMTQQEFEQEVVPRLQAAGAEDLIEVLRQRFLEAAPLRSTESGERGGHVNAQAAGLIREGMPGSTEGTGPQPVVANV